MSAAPCQASGVPVQTSGSSLQPDLDSKARRRRRSPPSSACQLEGCATLRGSSTRDGCREEARTALTSSLCLGLTLRTAILCLPVRSNPGWFLHRTQGFRKPALPHLSFLDGGSHRSERHSTTGQCSQASRSRRCDLARGAGP